MRCVSALTEVKGHEQSCPFLIPYPWLRYRINSEILFETNYYSQPVL